MSILDDVYLSRHMKEGPLKPLTNLQIPKPVPDSKEWWQDIAQGLGVVIHELKAEVADLKAKLAAVSPVSATPKEPKTTKSSRA